MESQGRVVDSQIMGVTESRARYKPARPLGETLGSGISKKPSP